MTTTLISTEITDYLADYPRQGIVRLYLDGTAKPATFARLVATRWLGQAGLITIDGRKVFVDAADLDELLDEIITAADEGVTHGQGLTLTAIAKTVHTMIETHNGGD